ncbi:MAG: SH3 domain-containing protein [Clostridia bacterium]|nr:SH3 domain-containing protein [Clostridia bacterium]
MSENIIQYVAAASNGDTDAMAKLYSKTLKASYFLAYTLSNDKDAALEITKKSYAKAFCTIDKLKRPEAFEIWMKQNVALVYKEGVKFVFSDADAGAVENSSEFLSEEIYNDEEASAKILSAVSELSPELRAAIVLHYNNGMPVNILAKFFGVSESTSNALLGKARSAILSAVELDSSNIENGALPVLTKIFQRSATVTAIENSFVRDIFIYAIDAYEASKPAEPVHEETVVPAPVEEAPAVQDNSVVQEATTEQDEVSADEAEDSSQSLTPEDSNVLAFKQKISEILSGESVPEDVQSETAESDVQDDVDVPEFVSEEKTQEAIEHFSNYESNDENSKAVVSDNKKKKFDLKINKKLIAIICASLVALIVICVAVSKITGGDKPGKTPANNDPSGVVDTLASGYDWRAGGFAECSEIKYLDENCISFKSVSTGKYGLLDYQGNVILQPNYDGFRHCRTGRDYSNSGIYHSLVVIGTEEYEFDVINGNVTISDTPHLDHTLNSETLGDRSYEERDRYFEGYAAARKDGKWGYVSQERDKKVIPYEYEAVNEYPSALDYAGSDYCRPVTDGHIAVKKNGMMGIINLENDIVVPFEYSNIMPGKNGVYIACKGGTWGVILLGDAVSSFTGINISIEPVSPDNSEDTTGSSTAYDSYTVISESGANVRDGAGADYEKIGELKYGDTVRAYDTKRADNGNKWVKIRYEGKYGWVAMSNLEEEGV